MLNFMQSHERLFAEPPTPSLLLQAKQTLESCRTVLLSRLQVSDRSR